MKVLFVHQNFPAQFRHVAEAFARSPGNQVVAIGSETARALKDVELHRYGVPASDPMQVHPFARTFDADCRRAEQVLYIASSLRAAGFVPSVIVVHTGWGEHLSLRVLFPDARIIAYAELFYRSHGLDVDFDPEFGPMSLDRQVGLRLRNASTLLALAEADVVVSPTRWQQASFPVAYRDAIEIGHDGIDVERARPDPSAQVTLPNGMVLRTGSEVVTYVSRNLEPLRGYHQFMRALPDVLRARPNAQIVIVGGDSVSYGASPPAGKTWKQFYLDEVAPKLDQTRVHFLGRVDYDHYLRLLAISAVHVYLTYPFVLSWSLLEAMACGCAVVASDTGPVLEVVDGTNGLLVDFFDTAKLARTITAVLSDPARYTSMRAKARQTVVQRFSLDSCIARWSSLVQTKT